MESVFDFLSESLAPSSPVTSHPPNFLLKGQSLGDLSAISGQTSSHLLVWLATPLHSPLPLNARVWLARLVIIVVVDLLMHNYDIRHVNAIAFHCNIVLFVIVAHRYSQQTQRYHKQSHQ